MSLFRRQMTRAEVRSARKPARLIPLLDGANPELRIEAALRLARLGEEIAVPILVEYLNDPASQTSDICVNRTDVVDIAGYWAGTHVIEDPRAPEVARTILRRTLNPVSRRSTIPSQRADERRMVHRLFMDSCTIAPDEAARALAIFYDDSPNGEGFVIGEPDTELVRDLGRRLDELGGIQLMREAHACFASERPSNAPNLEMLWDRIGDWLG